MRRTSKVCTLGQISPEFLSMFQIRFPNLREKWPTLPFNLPDIYASFIDIDRRSTQSVHYLQINV